MDNRDKQIKLITRAGNTAHNTQKDMKKQNNTYVVYDCNGNNTGVSYQASNKAEAMRIFKADTANYRKYGYYGKLARWYDGGVYGSTGKIY